MITKAITVLIVAGLVYLGLVQVVRFISKQYLLLIAFYMDMKVFFKSRKMGNRIIEIKIREPTNMVKEPLSVPVITSVAEAVKQEVATDTLKELIVGTVEDIVPNDVPKEEMQEKEIPEETFFISLNIEGKEYNGSDDVSAEELMVMSRTLSSSTVTPQDEIATAKTLYKIRNATLFTQVNAAAGYRIKGMFDKMATKASEIEKSAGYDYSRYIK